MPILHVFVDSNQKDAMVRTITYPILAGGPSKCTFSIPEELVINTFPDPPPFIEVKEPDSTIRFEGYISSKGRRQTVNKQGWYEYEAVCRSYYEYAQEPIDIENFDNADQDFSGNGVEFEEWKVREQPNKHVTWPPEGIDPVVFDDQEAAVELPENRIEIGETEENSLPSHVKVIVKRYREKRFPCLAVWTETPVTADMLNNTPRFANYGKLFRVMNPSNPALPFSGRPLFNANVGSSKFAVLGSGSGYPKSENLSLGATLNPRTSSRVIPRSGAGSGSGSGSGSGPAEYKNFTKVEMKFFNGVELPRVEGAHGSAQETYVRARYLESSERIAVGLGGFSGEDKLGEFEHIEVEVQYDINDGDFYRDLTFAGPSGLLSEEHDQGEGKWTDDLSDTYIETEGINRANAILNNALLHYTSMRFSCDVTLAGVNYDYNRKLIVGENDICLNDISWSFGSRAEENRTRYTGVRLLDGGFSAALAKKKRWIQQQEVKDKEKRSRQQAAQEPATHVDHVTRHHARISWFLDNTGADFSEAEVVKNNGTSWVATGELVWISFDDSKGISFQTAGDDTIFEIEKIKSNVTRVATTRDLYRAIACAQEGGDSKRITHLVKIAKFSGTTSTMVVRMATSQLVSDKVWIDIETYGDTSSVYLKTTIGGSGKFNQIRSVVPNEWDLSGSEDFLYMERSGYNVCLPFLISPINPVLNSGKVWDSLEKKIDGTTTIAVYRKK